MQSRFVLRLFAAVVVIAAFVSSGCIRSAAPHVTLPPAPAKDAPKAERQAYVDKYRAETVGDDHVVLADGTRVEHPEDLNPAFHDVTASSAAADDYEGYTSNFPHTLIWAPILTVAFLALPVAGYVVTDAVDSRLGVLSLPLVFCTLYGGGLMLLAWPAACASTICGPPIVFSRAVNSRKEAFASYNESLERILEEVPLPKPADDDEHFEDAPTSDDEMMFDEGTEGSAF